MPGVGPKTAQRMALHLLERNREGGMQLSAVLAEAMQRIGRCKQCRDLTELEVCAICANPRRDQSLLCVVESPVDVLAIEQATAYKGCILYYWAVCHHWMESGRPNWVWINLPSALRKSHRQK